MVAKPKRGSNFKLLSACGMLGSLAAIPVPRARVGAEGQADGNRGQSLLETWSQIVTFLPPPLVLYKALEQWYNPK